MGTVGLWTLLKYSLPRRRLLVLSGIGPVTLNLFFRTGTANSSKVNCYLPPNAARCSYDQSNSFSVSHDEV